MDPELATLLREAWEAPGLDRIHYRDRIAPHGDAAISALASWIDDPVRSGFAIRTIAAAAMFGTRDHALATLRSASPGRSAHVHDDLLREIRALETRGRSPVAEERGLLGATVVGVPKPGAEYSPPLSPGEIELRRTLEARLPDGWRIFVRPHLDGDRPALALLHRERGAMVWDVRDVDLTDLTGGPKSYRWRGGGPWLDPVDRINAVRGRLYREYLPEWAEAIDDKRGRFGIVRAGIYFPSGSRSELQRLQLNRKDEVVIGQGELASSSISQLVPRANKPVEMRDAWFTILNERFSEYHPPTFPEFTPNKPQQRLIEEPLLRGDRGLQGVAGSGKSTVLARRAGRLASGGHQVLLVTYNLTLANYCRALVQGAPDRFLWSGVTVQHFHGLCHVLLRHLDVPAPPHPRGRADDEGPSSSEDLDAQTQAHYDERWPSVTQAALDLHGVSPGFVFDSILVDEAQDFSPAFLSVLDRLRSPDGETLLAFDKAQTLYARADALKARLVDMRRVRRLNSTKRMRQRHAGIASALGLRHRLETDQITPDEEPSLLLGEERTDWCDVPDLPSALAVASQLVERWRSEDGYRPDDTVVLVNTAKAGRALVTLLTELDIDVNHVFPAGGRGDWRQYKVTFVPNDQRMKVSTIHSFKGWDANDVILIEPATSNSRSIAATYVALTRPRRRLAVITSGDGTGIRHLFDDLEIAPDDKRVQRAADLLRDPAPAGPRPRASDKQPPWE